MQRKWVDGAWSGEEWVEFSEVMLRTASAMLTTIDEVTIDEYFDGLHSYPLSRVIAALKMARDTLKFFPKIVELKELMGVGVEQVPGPKALKRYVPPEEPQQIKAEIRKFREQMGWVKPGGKPSGAPPSQA